MICRLRGLCKVLDGSALLRLESEVHVLMVYVSLLKNNVFPYKGYFYIYIYRI